MDATPSGHAELVRYLDGELEQEERAKVEQHLATCGACRDQLEFAKGFRAGLRKLSKEELTTDEPCPDSWTLVSYEAGDVDEETARHLRVHLLLCDDCAEEFY